MKWIFMTLIGILSLTPLVNAHAIEKGPVSKSVENYTIQFLTKPKFPVIGKSIHLDFIIKDNQENLLSGLDVKIELHKGERTIILNLNEESKGHYSIEHTFEETGIYEVHSIINDNEVDLEFDLEVDTFGLSGFLRSGVIMALLLIFSGLMYRDCKNRD